MRRRDFIVLVGAASGSPIFAWGQRGTNIPRVGILWHAGSADEEGVYLRALVEGFTNLGYIDGKTILFEHRFPNERPDRFVSLAAELVALKVDVLIAVTKAAATAAQRATTTIPIVFIVVPDPVGAGLVASLGHPGGNITGFTHITVELMAKRLGLFKEAFPSSSHVALLVNANDERGMQRYTQQTQTAAQALGMAVQVVEVRSLEDFERAFDIIAKNNVEGIILPADGLFFQGRARLAELALLHRISLVVYSRETVEAGALMSYGADQPTMFRRAGAYVDKILKGERPAELPVEQPTRFEFIVNLKTMKALGITLPPTLVSRADEVVE
jgi:putative tryptophan/tyrosine transport system substrate-binding protein